MVSVNLYSKNNIDLKKFLHSFYNSNSNLKFEINSSNTWEHHFNNPIELADIVGAYIDNSDKFDLAMWVSLDINFYISVTDKNANELIEYLFERYPY